MEKTTEQTKKKTFSLYRLASGTPGKKFTVKEFLEIVNEGKVRNPSSKYTYRLKDGYVYHADSRQEIVLIKKLESRKAFRRLRGQCVSIPYRRGGKDHVYTPDIVLLTPTKRIVFIEVKDVAQMNTAENKKKYDHMAKYCKKHGYLYLMCDKQFRVYERLEEVAPRREVVEAIEAAIAEKGYFDWADHERLITGKDRKKKKAIDRSIVRYMIQDSSLRMIGDLWYETDKFRIYRSPRIWACHPRTRK